jgi:hypothetical protein
MTSPSWELQKAVFARLQADGPLVGLIGGSRIYNDVPRGAPLPYVTIGETTVRDWSTGTDEGHEHLLTVAVWSRANGEREVHQIVAAVEAVLDDADLAMSGVRLVNLRHEFSEVRRDADGETSRGLVRFRAVTEPAP